MSSQAEPSWCRTTFGDTAVATFRWTIDNFMNRPEKSKEKLKSTYFIVNGPGDLRPSGDCIFIQKARRRPVRIMSGYFFTIEDKSR